MKLDWIYSWGHSLEFAKLSPNSVLVLILLWCAMFKWLLSRSMWINVSAPWMCLWAIYSVHVLLCVFGSVPDQPQCHFIKRRASQSSTLCVYEIARDLRFHFPILLKRWYWNVNPLLVMAARTARILFNVSRAAFWMGVYCLNTVIEMTLSQPIKFSWNTILMLPWWHKPKKWVGENLSLYFKKQDV